jgi:hypothetical protein
MFTLMRLVSLLSGILIMATPSAGYATDFTTPQGAVRALEEAYKAQDIEAAAAARDFREEARQLLLRQDPEKAADPEMLRQGAILMEVMFEEEMKQTGFPNYAGLTCVVSEPTYVSDSVVKVTERCQSSDGSVSEQHFLVFLGSQGWRVIGVAYE